MRAMLWAKLKLAAAVLAAAVVGVATPAAVHRAMKAQGADGAAPAAPAPAPPTEAAKVTPEPAEAAPSPPPPPPEEAGKSPAGAAPILATTWVWYIREVGKDAILWGYVPDDPAQSNRVPKSTHQTAIWPEEVTKFAALPPVAHTRLWIRTPLTALDASSPFLDGRSRLDFVAVRPTAGVVPEAYLAAPLPPPPPPPSVPPPTPPTPTPPPDRDEKALQAIREEYENSTPAPPLPERVAKAIQAYREAYRLQREGNEAGAREALRKLIEEFPGTGAARMAEKDLDHPILPRGSFKDDPPPAVPAPSAKPEAPKASGAAGGSF